MAAGIPANPCEICDVARSRGAFSVNDGASCDDGLFCTTGDSCSGGNCAGTTTDFCDDGVACNGAETCSEGSDRCVAGATTCGAGEACDAAADRCLTTCSGCVIGGVCYAPSTTDPLDACQVCDPIRSVSGWSVNDGGTCDDGLFCTTGDRCDATGSCTGAARACGDGVSCNGAESCNESSDRCDVGATTCTAGMVCDAGSDMCLVTCAGCTIGGRCYAPGSSNPANPCELCDTASSSSAWTANVGATCDDGQYCTTGETCSATGDCESGAARDCSDGVMCNGTESCNEASDRCDSGTTTCGAGTVCDAGSDTCQLSCGGGTTQCGVTCVDTDSDPTNCGGCGTSCAGASSTGVCVGGSCRYLCDSGFGDCDAMTDGCETDLGSDRLNCGFCGNTCATGCSAGVCSDWVTSPAPVFIPGSTGCTILQDSGADQIDALDSGLVAVLLRCGSALAMAVSNDNGRSFAAPRSFQSLPQVATIHARSDGDIFMMYASGPNVLVRHTPNQGVSWTSPVLVGAQFSGAGGPGPSLNLVSSGSTLYATWSNPSQNVGPVARSTNDGASWTQLPQVDVGGRNYAPDLGFDPNGTLVYMNEPAHRIFRFTPPWAPVGALGGASYSDFAMGGNWAYSGGSTSAVRRAPMTGPFSVTTQSAAGTRGSMDADADGDLYYARALSSSVTRLYRWVSGAASIGAPVDVTVPTRLMTLASPPRGNASVTAIVVPGQPVRVHVQAY